MACATWIASSRVGTRMIACTSLPCGIDVVDRGQAERGGLAGARLCLPDHVAARDTSGMAWAWMGVGSV